MTSPTDIPARVIGLVSPSSYRATMFRDAARRLGLEWVEVIDQPAAIGGRTGKPDRIAVDFSDVPQAIEDIFEVARGARAVLAVDDRGTLLAAEVSSRLHLPHNDPGSALAGRDKLVMRERLAANGVPVPAFRALGPDDDPVGIAAESVGYPCVVKPTRLNGSRGVIRADTAEELRAAVAVTRRIVAAVGDPHGGGLIERFVPGFEVALEGLLTNGALEALALFDKPDPLDGPLFEETLYVTPSRLDGAVQDAIVAMTARSAAALGLRHGPLHAELRVDLATGEIWPIELAGRSIGGLCASVLEFEAGIGLDEVILRHAVGMPVGGFASTDANERDGAVRADTRSDPTTTGASGDPVQDDRVARADTHSLRSGQAPVAPTMTGSPNVILSAAKDLRAKRTTPPHPEDAESGLHPAHNASRQLRLRRGILPFAQDDEGNVAGGRFDKLRMTNGVARADTRSAPTSVGASGVASGVMMIPIPQGGMLRAVGGIDAAKEVPGIVDIEITAPLNAPIVPLPEGESYLGFIFARAATPDQAEAALREAHAHLAIRIDPTISLAPISSLPVEQPGDQGRPVAGDRVDVPRP